MEDSSKLIGRKMKGFRFEKYSTGTPYPDLDSQIGAVGEIVEIYEDKGFKPRGWCAVVRFGDDVDWEEFDYPLDQVHEHLIPEETEDPYKCLKEAHAAGKTIEVYSGTLKKWRPVSHPKWESPAHHYRVATEEKGTRKIEDTSPYDTEAIEEAVNILQGHIKDAQNYSNYPQDASGIKENITVLNEISQIYKTKLSRLSKAVQYLEQLK